LFYESLRKKNDVVLTGAMAVDLLVERGQHFYNFLLRQVAAWTESEKSGRTKCSQDILLTVRNLAY
jgi:hypothetical protein